MSKKAYFVEKRIFDILVSALGIIITLPIWLLAMIGIKISDPGTVFYIANRIGKDNKKFRMFKFRSMRVDSKADERAFKADLNRIFKFGDFMRRTKIDELPQLFNVLIGDMSIVGPRPASVDQVDIVRTERNAIVATIKCGLTSPSALYDYIYGDLVKDEQEYEKLVLPTRLKLDRYYVERQSILYDIKIIWYTVVCMIDLIIGRYPSRIFNELVNASSDFLEESCR